MPSKQYLFTNANFGLLFAVTLTTLFAVGCHKEDEIVVHHLPKLNSASADDGTPDRMIVGLASDKGNGWYFKLVGKERFVDEVADSFVDFLRTVEFTDKRLPDWDAPKDWKEIPPSSSMRKATFEIGEEKLELAITSFPLVGSVDESLLLNVNRWRKHMSLAPLEKLGDSLEELSNAKTDIQVMDVIGNFNGGMSGGAPFMNAAKGMPSPHGDTPGKSQGESPPARSTPEVPPTVKRPALDFELPDGWTKGKASMFSVYAFDLADKTPEKVGDEKNAEKDDDKKGDNEDAKKSGTAKVSISSMTKTNTWKSSLGMWKGQLGQPDMSDEDAEKLTESITVDGIEGKLILIESPKDSEKQQAMIGVRIEKDDSAWFFKMSGDNATVLGHKEEFESFLKSVKFK